MVKMIDDVNLAMSTTVIGMCRYVMEALFYDLESLDKNLTVKSIPQLERCTNHISFLINMYDNYGIKNDIDECENNFTKVVFSILSTSVKTAHKFILDTIHEINNPKKLRKVFIINGAGGSGKDTFIELISQTCMDDYDNKIVLNVSSVDKIKQAAHLLGWDGVKDAKGRAFLHQLKSMSEGEYEGVKKYVYEKVETAPKDSIVFIHIREPREITKTINYLNDISNTQVSTILVRSNRGVKLVNGADDVVDYYDYDHIIDNSGTIPMLAEAAKEFLKNIDIKTKDDKYNLMVSRGVGLTNVPNSPELKPKL